MRLFITIAALSCAFLFLHQPRTARADDLQGVKESVQQQYYEITGKDTSVLKFAKGSTHLSDSGSAELRTTMNAIKENTAIREIIVLAYADRAYPRGKKADLSQASKNLAQKRGDNVKGQISELGGKNITVHNMATKASWLEKTFVTRDAQLKREAVEPGRKEDADDSFYQNLGRQAATEGGPGIVLVVMRKQWPLSH